MNKGYVEGYLEGYREVKEVIISTIANQYSEHGELIPSWLSIGNITRIVEGVAKSATSEEERTMKIDWKRKLTSRKFWLAVASFVTMLIVYFTGDSEKAEKVSALIMAGASVVAFIIGEGLADGGHIGE